MEPDEYHIRVTRAGTPGDTRFDYIELLLDLVAPNAITDLDTSDVTTTTVKLTWTAPGDDGSAGVATEYDLRYHTEMITDETWSLAIPVEGLESPLPPGFEETWVVGGLAPDTEYYFAIKARDEMFNWPGLSNVILAKTKDPVPVQHTTWGQIKWLHRETR